MAGPGLFSFAAAVRCSGRQLFPDWPGFRNATACHVVVYAFWPYGTIDRGGKMRDNYSIHRVAGVMALRKTVAQWIQEVSGEEESRILYRAEGYGTHYSSYVCNLTAAQVEKLDKALDKVREKVFGGG